MSSINGSTDYASLLNQNKLNTASGLLGSNTSVGPLSGDLINQWAMLRSNSSAYRKLLEAQQTGSVKKEEGHYTELMSDRYFNDNYDTKTGKYVNNTYKPDAAVTPTLDSEATAADNLESMRSLALAAMTNPDSLTDFHYELFEKMRQSIADGLVKTGSGSEDPTVTVEEATPATITANAGDFHLLVDDQNFTVGTKTGEKNYNFQAGTSLQSIVSAINADSAETGVKAELTKDSDGNYQLAVMSSETGKDSEITLYQNTGTLFSESASPITAKGTDAVTQKAETVATGDQTVAAVAAGVYSGKLFGDQAFTIAGARGSKEYSFASGTDIGDVVSAINANSGETGVMAEVIYNDAGVAEGIGLIADKAGAGQYVQVTQDAGDLFANAGKTIKVAGAGTTDQSKDGPAINSLADLGKVTIDNKTYSFADLVQGGSASLANNQDAALAILDQTLRDIYEGRAQVKGFDPSEQPRINMYETKPTAVSNTLEVGNFGSDALTQWLSAYVAKTED